MLSMTVDIFESGKVFHRGRLIASGTAAYLHGIVNLLFTVGIPLALLSGPKWFLRARTLTFIVAGVIFFVAIVIRGT